MVGSNTEATVKSPGFGENLTRKFREQRRKDIGATGLTSFPNGILSKATFISIRGTLTEVN